MYIITQSTWLRGGTGTMTQHLPVCHGMQVQVYWCTVGYLLWINQY